MKGLKLAMWFAIAISVLLLVALFALFSQPVQKRILARLVNPRAGDHFAVEHARIGFTRTEIRGFVLDRPDISYRVEFLDADLSIWDIYFNRHVKIGDIKATGVEFDFARFTKVPRPEDPNPLEGLLGELDVPVKLSIGEGLMEGRLLLPGVGEEPLTIRYRIKGGGLAPGESGKFSLNAVIEDRKAEGWLRELELKGDIVLGESTDGVFESLTTDAKIHVLGVKIPVEELILNVKMQKTAEGEDYLGSIYHAGDDEALRPLLQVDASFAYDDRMFRGNWEAWAERGQVAGYLYVARLPEFSGQGNGKFSYDNDEKSLWIAGSFDAETGELQIVAAEMQGLGGVTAATEFEFLRDDDWLLLEAFHLHISSTKSGETLVVVDSKNPLRYDRKEARITGTAERTDLMDIAVTTAPIEWIGLFRGEEAGNMPLLVDGNISGELLLSAFNGGILVETLAPLTAFPVTAAAQGNVLLEDAGLEVSGAFSWIDSEIGIRVDPLLFTVDKQMAIQIEGRYSQIENEFSARIQADLPVFLKEHIVSIENLSSGLLEAEVQGDAFGSFQGGLVLRETVIEATGEKLPPVYLNFQVEPDEQRNWHLNLPLSIDREGKPFGFTLSGTVFPDDKNSSFDLALTGEHIFLETLLDYKNAFARSETKPSTKDSSPEDPTDDTPFLANWNGHLGIAFDTIQFPGGYSLEQIRTQIDTDSANLKLVTDAVFLGSQISADAHLGITDQGTTPYQFSGEIHADHADFGALFRALQHNRPPTLEGVFTIDSTLRSDAKNLGDLLTGMRGDIRFSSDGGVLRLFHSEDILVNLGLSFAGLLGGIGGEYGTIVEIAEEFAHIPYDEAKIRIERTDNLDFLLRDLQVLAPEFHLEGIGVLEHVEGRKFSAQPVNLELKLGTRGELEQLLARAELLSETRDPLGYRALKKPFSLSGSFSELQVNPLVSVVVGAIFELMVPSPGTAGKAREEAAPPREN